MLHHEKLDVYRLSVDFVRYAHRLSERIPKGYGALADQLRRAAASIPSNIAEGVGKYGDVDKARFHAIARGSATECAALLDVVRAIGAAPDEEITRAKHMVERMVSMLTRLVLVGQRGGRVRAGEMPTSGEIDHGARARARSRSRSRSRGGQSLR